MSRTCSTIFSAITGNRERARGHHCGALKRPQPVDALVPVRPISEAFAPQGTSTEMSGRVTSADQQDAALRRKTAISSDPRSHMHELHRDAGDSDIERVKKVRVGARNVASPPMRERRCPVSFPRSLHA